MKNSFKAVVALSVISLVSACGLDDRSVPTAVPSGQSGKITQGPVSGATIYADSLVAGSGSRFVRDAGEIFTTTDAGGNFTLPTQPAYSHVLVSTGGTDTLTNKPAMEMIAPAGSKNVTPLTTLVALDTTGSLKAKIEALLPAGAKFDADISTVTSPAALLLVQSVETAVRAITAAVNSGANISAAQLASVQTEVMQSIAAELATIPAANFVATVSTPATLALEMQAAADAALITLDAEPNISISAVEAAAASASVATAVTSTATAMSLPLNSAAATTQIVGGEAAVITPTVADSITNAVTVAATAIDGKVTTTVTPPAYVPPPVEVVGAPMVSVLTPAIGSVVAGGSTATITAAFTEAMLNSATDAASGANPANWLIKAGTATIAVASVSYDAASKTFSATTASALPNGATITVTIKNAVKSAAGVALTNDVTWSFTTKLTGTTGATGSTGTSLN